MRTEIKKLHAKLGTTFIYVTHDQTEAMTMGDRIVVMKDGLKMQEDTPQNLYDKPGNVFVAGFIGTPQMNMLSVRLAKRGGEFFAEYGDFAIKIPESKNPDGILDGYVGKDLLLGIRPEHVRDEPAYLQRYADSVITASVEVTELMGNEIFLYLSSYDNSVVARVSPTSTAKAGDALSVCFITEKIHLFDKETELTIVN
jgi:multiple sugar transport system ATP-binding protein